MSNFTTTFTHQSVFDGDTVKVELRRLKRKHVAKLSPFFAQAESGEIKLKFADQLQLLEVLEHILPECVVSIDGLKDKGNNALKLSDIIEDIYFMPLFQGWMGALVSSSFMKGDEEKKSVPQPPAVSSVGPAVAT